MKLIIKQEFSWDARRKVEIHAFALFRKDEGKDEIRVSNFFDTLPEAVQMMEDYKEELRAMTKNNVAHEEEFNPEEN